MKKLFIVFFFILMMVMPLFSEPVYEDYPSLLRKTDVPGLHLIRSKREIWKWSDMDFSHISFSPLYKGVDLKKIASKELVSYYESWGTISHEQIVKNRSKGIQEDYLILTIYRDCLKSNEAAREWVKKRMAENPVGSRAFQEGSFSGKKFGDQCWHNGLLYNKQSGRKSPSITFIKGNYYVVVGATRMKSNVEPEFVEKIAEIVESRL